MTGNQLKKKKKVLPAGCLVFIVIAIVSITLFNYCVIGANVNDEYDDYNDDCNNRYIEKDHNGDGKEDAKDFLIQTEDC